MSRAIVGQDNRPRLYLLSSRLLPYFILLLSLILSRPAIANDNYSIIFVHLGEKVPDYAKEAFIQARTFNPDCPIILLANGTAIDALSSDDELQKAEIIYVAAESLSHTNAHQRFIKETSLDGTWREGFWRYASERFLYLADLMHNYDLSNVFHLEYDNMLYADLGEKLPVFEQYYPGIAATFDNDARCIPGFIFFRSKEAINGLAECFARYAKAGHNDMHILALHRHERKGKGVGLLPIVHAGYVAGNPLVSPMGHQAKRKSDYCSHIDAFDSIFDAAAIGQYLGGIDPRNGPSAPGFINESCVFNPSRLSYVWKLDDQDRWVPFALYNGEERRINNLHIHSKKLALFSSKSGKIPLFIAY